MSKENCGNCKDGQTGCTVCRYYGAGRRKGNEPYQLAAGTVLNGRYLIGRVLGEGGFGITYLSWDMQTDSRAAVKEFFPSGMALRDMGASAEVKSTGIDAEKHFAEYKERFLREYQTLAGLSDISGIVQVSDYFTENHTAYIVMEYVEGITLKQYVVQHGGKLLAKEVFAMLKPVLYSLVNIHEAGLVHRDISPDNLVVLADGKVKLLDFGAARKVRKDAVAERPLTKSTVAVYKHGYTPLEQYQSKGGIGPWTDVYAYCATVYYCLTGNEPPDALERLLQDEEIHPRESGADLSEYEEGILLRGMELRASDRIADMHQLAEALFANQQVADTGKAEVNLSEGEETGRIGVGRIKPARVKWKKRRFVLALFLATAVFSGLWAVSGLPKLQSGSEPTQNKAIAFPVYYGRMDEELQEDDGTWVGLNCGEVAAFSESFTYSCSLYIPKEVCGEESSRVKVEFWMDLSVGEEVIGVLDSVSAWELLNEHGEVFPVAEENESVMEESEYGKFFRMQEEGDYYKLEVTELPYQSRMHLPVENFQGYFAINTDCGGSITVNFKVSGISAIPSCKVYVDDIVVKDNGTVLKSYDCSVKSLYGRPLFYEYNNGDGKKVQMDHPVPEVVRF